jgi:steroid 5-alpha reductase family enzyme
MNEFPLGAFLTSAALSLAAVIAFMLGTFVVALRAKRHSVVDTAWGLGFSLVAVLGWLLSIGEGDLAGRTVILVLTMIWGLRLAAHMARRSHGMGEDPRYAELMSRAGGNPKLFALRMIYLTQGGVLWFVSLPVQVAMFAPGPWSWWALAGVLLWAIGLAFEATGDAQLAAFKRDPGNHGKVMNRGLWSLTRHPNYFGDTCVWWGIYLAAAVRWPGVLTVLSPAIMTYILVKGTGKSLLEKRMRDRPGFAEYVRRTNGFIPWFPRN